MAPYRNRSPILHALCILSVLFATSVWAQQYQVQKDLKSGKEYYQWRDAEGHLILSDFAPDSPKGSAYQKSLEQSSVGGKNGPVGGYTSTDRTVTSLKGVAPTPAGECPTAYPIKAISQTYANRRWMIYILPVSPIYTKTKSERCYATEGEAKADGARETFFTSGRSLSYRGGQTATTPYPSSSYSRPQEQPQTTTVSPPSDSTLEREKLAIEQQRLQLQRQAAQQAQEMQRRALEMQQQKLYLDALRDQQAWEMEQRRLQLQQQAARQAQQMYWQALQAQQRAAQQAQENLIMQEVLRGIFRPKQQQSTNCRVVPNGNQYQVNCW